jgi:hypothetical protein
LPISASREWEWIQIEKKDTKNPYSTVSGYHAEYGYGQYSSPSAYQQQQQHYYSYHAPYHASYTALPPSTSGSIALNNSSGSNSNSSGVTNTANRNEFGSIRRSNKNQLSIPVVTKKHSMA